MYNRARFIILENKAGMRNSVEARATYDSILVPLGGYYCGWMLNSTNIGPTPAHFYMFDDPSPETLAALLKLVSAGQVRAQIIRERWSEGITYDVGQIMQEIALAMHDNLRTPLDSQVFAQCWEGIKVLEALAK